MHLLQTEQGHPKIVLPNLHFSSELVPTNVNPTEIIKLDVNCDVNSEIYNSSVWTVNIKVGEISHFVQRLYTGCPR